jgi:hypothetical protein
MNTLFLLSNVLVMPFWVIMLLYDRRPWSTRIIQSPLQFVPLIALYAWLIIPSYPSLLPVLMRPELTALSQLMQTPLGTTTAWIHLLAFDLFVGLWMYLDAQQYRTNAWLVRLCLLCTFMAGPLGLGIYLIVRSTRFGATPIAQRP